MNYLFKLIDILIQSMLSILQSPFFWLLIMILFLQYYRIGKLEKKILGANKQSVYERVVYSTLSGLIGGMLGSILLIILGVTIDTNNFRIILGLALILMLIHPRFLCFSYSGGIVSIVSLIFNISTIDVSSIMIMVAVLHLIESLLIRVDAYKTRIPIFIENNGRTVGGFNMIRYWPIPLILQVPINYQLTISGIVAALGYGDMTITEYPKDRARHSSNQLLIYSIALLVFSLLSLQYNLFKAIAAVFAPVAHELIIQHSIRKERSRKPLFAPENKGVRVLDTSPNGIANKMGINSGDIIVSINGINVNSIEDIRRIMVHAPSYIWIDYFDKNGKLLNKDYCDYRNGIKDLGLLVVPKYSSFVLDINKSQSIIIRLFKLIKRKLAI